MQLSADVMIHTSSMDRLEPASMVRTKSVACLFYPKTLLVDLNNLYSVFELLYIRKAAL